MELELHMEAVGSCIMCGSNVDGSLYWVPMTQAQRDVIRPLIAHMFKPDMIQDIFFIPQLCKPLCGPQCSLKHKEKIDGKTA